MVGKWLSYRVQELNGVRADYGCSPAIFKKAFSLNSEIKSVCVKITALGVYKLYLNGIEIDIDRLSPGWSDYAKRVYYYEYDITDSVERENVFTVTVGDGWYAGRLGMFLNREFYGSEPCFMLECNILYANGESEKIVSDESWLAGIGQIVYSDILSGEAVDARRSEEFNGTPKILNLPPIEIQRAVCPPIRIKEYFTGKRLENNIYDFSQNFAGVIRAEIRGERGAKITFTHGELLTDDGKLYTQNLRSAYSKDVYICGGGSVEIFEPLFTYHGFRYAAAEIEGEAEILNIQGVCFYTDLPAAGGFTCDNDIVNKIYKNTFYSQKSNFMSIPTDCPQRDERLGWTADAQVFCSSAMFNMDCRGFFDKYLSDIRDCQGSDGGIEVVAPYVLSKYIRRRRGSAGWCDALTIITYEHYVRYGDKKIIKDNLSAAKAWLDYCLNDSEGCIRLNDSGYGDWLSLDAETDKGVIATAYMAYSSHLTAKMCEYVGDVQSKYYYSLYEKICKAFITEFVDANGKIKSDTQTAYLLACSFSILSANQIKPHLMRKLEQFNYKLSTGFLGVKYILPVLCEIGEADLAYRLISSTEYPSWGYSVINGATTIWERWDSYVKGKGYADILMNSFNHYAYGSCVEWLYKYVLGINLSEKHAGGRQINLEPHFDFSGSITSASGFYITDIGKLAISWNKDGSNITYTVTKPKKLQVTFNSNGLEHEKTYDDGVKIIYQLKKYIQ